VAKKKLLKPKYEVELVLGQRDTGMMLPKNTGNWFSYRIFTVEGRRRKEIGIVEIGRGSIFWKPYRSQRDGTSFRRSWEQFAARMER
jgi:hypothetical protein